MTALSTIRWTEDNYTPNEVIRIANGFPKLIQVERGCEGDTPLETVDAGQIFRYHGSVRQTRVLARDTKGNLLSLPLAYPQKLTIVERKKNKRAKVKSMRDILKSYDLPLAVALSGVRRRMGSDHRSVKDEPFEAGGEIELAGTHLISFLIVNRINQAGVIEENVVLIPAYLDIQIKFAHAAITGNDISYKALMGMYNKSVAHIKYVLVHGPRGVIAYNGPLDDQSERQISRYVTPQSSIRSIRSSPRSTILNNQSVTTQVSVTEEIIKEEVKKEEVIQEEVTKVSTEAEVVEHHESAKEDEEDVSDTETIREEITEVVINEKETKATSSVVDETHESHSLKSDHVEEETSSSTVQEQEVVSNGDVRRDPAPPAIHTDDTDMDNYQRISRQHSERVIKHLGSGQPYGLVTTYGSDGHYSLDRGHNHRRDMLGSSASEDSQYTRYSGNNYVIPRPHVTNASMNSSTNEQWRPRPTLRANDSLKISVQNMGYSPNIQHRVLSVNDMTSSGYAGGYDSTMSTLERNRNTTPAQLSSSLVDIRTGDVSYVNHNDMVNHNWITKPRQHYDRGEQDHVYRGSDYTSQTQTGWTTRISSGKHSVTIPTRPLTNTSVEKPAIHSEKQETVTISTDAELNRKRNSRNRRKDVKVTKGANSGDGAVKEHIYENTSRMVHNEHTLDINTHIVPTNTKSSDHSTKSNNTTTDRYKYTYTGVDDTDGRIYREIPVKNLKVSKTVQSSSLAKDHNGPRAISQSTESLVHVKGKRRVSDPHDKKNKSGDYYSKVVEPNLPRRSSDRRSRHVYSSVDLHASDSVHDGQTPRAVDKPHREQNGGHRKITTKIIKTGTFTNNVEREDHVGRGNQTTSYERKNAETTKIPNGKTKTFQEASKVIHSEVRIGDVKGVKEGVKEGVSIYSHGSEIQPQDNRREMTLTTNKTEVIQTKPVQNGNAGKSNSYKKRPESPGFEKSITSTSDVKMSSEKTDGNNNNNNSNGKVGSNRSGDYCRGHITKLTSSSTAVGGGEKASVSHHVKAGGGGEKSINGRPVSNHVKAMGGGEKSSSSHTVSHHVEVQSESRTITTQDELNNRLHPVLRPEPKRNSPLPHELQDSFRSIHDLDEYLRGQVDPDAISQSSFGSRPGAKDLHLQNWSYDTKF